MNDTLVFTLTSLALFAGFFSLGSCSALFLRHRTRILQVALRFIAGLLFLNVGFWLRCEPLAGTAWGFARGIPADFAQILGLVLLIAQSPVLVGTLLALGFPKPARIALGSWTGVAASLGLAYLAIKAATGREEGAFAAIANAQLAITVVASLSALALRVRDARPLATRKALVLFLAATAAFLPAFAADIAISLAGPSRWSVLDNLSVPTYFLALNAGSFAFVAKFLGSGPLVVGGRVSDECREIYGMTRREIELAERLLAGRSNQEIADELFISRKTVENHLYNTYQKMGVKNRIQFLRALESRGRP